jgi:hypothetical protein
MQKSFIQWDAMIIRMGAATIRLDHSTLRLHGDRFSMIRATFFKHWRSLNRLHIIEKTFAAGYQVMFGKKPPSEPSQPGKPDQSQSFSNVTLTGGMLQAGQAGRDLQQSQSGELQTQQQGMTGTEVATLLERLERAVKGSAIDPAVQEELLDYLRPAKREAAKENPSKELVGQNLKQVSETLKTLNETTEAGKSLWQTGAEIFKTIAPWLGMAVHIFGV